MMSKRAHRLSRLLAGAALVWGVGAYSTAGASASTTTGSLSINFKAIGAAKATGKTLSLAKAAPGIFVIGPNGHSLYVFNKDQGTKSACTGTCATYWPALTASGSVTLGAGIKKSEVGKANGQKPNQITYYGHLLYYYVGDTAPGQTTGTKISGWHLLGPFGNVMMPKS
jgi:predicted lipoprotein with Yx(FWY)xxD motif